LPRLARFKFSGPDGGPKDASRSDRDEMVPRRGLFQLPLETHSVILMKVRISFLLPIEGKGDSSFRWNDVI
jgi:hypothetical protein